MIHIDTNPFLFCYSGANCNLPEALTNIGPDGLDIVIAIWGTEDIDDDGEEEWVSYDVLNGAGDLGNYGLEEGKLYVLIHEDGICQDWDIPSPPDTMEPLPLSQVRYWAYQIQEINETGAVDKLSSSNYDMLILEPTKTDWSSGDRDFDTKGMVSQLNDSVESDGTHRKLLLAYIDKSNSVEIPVPSVIVLARVTSTSPT